MSGFLVMDHGSDTSSSLETQIAIEDICICINYGTFERRVSNLA